LLEEAKWLATIFAGKLTLMDKSTVFLKSLQDELQSKIMTMKTRGSKKSSSRRGTSRRSSRVVELKSGEMSGGMGIQNILLLLYIFAQVASALQKVFLDVEEVEKYVEYQVKTNVTTWPYIPIIHRLFQWVSPDEANMARDMYKIQTIVDDLNNKYIDTEKRSAAVGIRNMCRKIFSSKEVGSILDKARNHDADDFSNDAMLEDDEELDKETWAAHNLRYCEQMPIPHFSFDTTTGVVGLHISKTPSYHDLLKRFNYLIDQLNTYSSDQHIENEIIKLRYITRHIIEIIDAFKYSETLIGKLSETSYLIQEYFDTFLQIENVNGDIEDKKVFERRIRINEEQNRMRRMENQQNREGMALLTSQLLSYITGMTYGVIDETTHIGEKTVTGASGILNTFIDQTKGSLVFIVLIFFIMRRSNNSGNSTDVKFLIQELKEERGTNRELLKLVASQILPAGTRRTRRKVAPS
jgi:hypothetical protein